MAYDQGPKGLVNQPIEMKDPYYTRGKDFPVPDSGKGTEAGPQDLVNQSAHQKDASLNVSGGTSMRGPAVWGDEGRKFPTSGNGGESNSKASDEQPTYAGARASVSVSLVDGQISPPIKKERI
jgi:hypothetical protein